MRRSRLLLVVVLSGAALVLGRLAWDDGGANSKAAPDLDAAGVRALGVRVPSAIMIARGLDEISVTVDTASLVDTTVTVHPGMTLGVESDCVVYPANGARPSGGRHGLASSADFVLGTSTWTTKTDGLPQRGTKYVGEMSLVLFETDIPAGPHWDPHAGKLTALWSVTLRQAEE